MIFLKVALLNRYCLTDADFRDNFRQAKPEDGERFNQFGNRVTGYLDRRIELSETPRTFDGVRDLISVRDWLYRLMSVH